MPFNTQNIPDSLKNMDEEVKNKAIEIINALMEKGHEEGQAIPIGIAKAEEWAQNRNIPIVIPGVYTQLPKED